MTYLIAIDQGTTSSRAILFDKDQNVINLKQKETRQIYPQPGWVEQDPQDIWATTYGVLQELIAASGIKTSDIAALGITNQRETTIVWERKTGKVLYNAIVWQCRRSAQRVEKLKAEGLVEKIQTKTGLVPDAYFSATKLAWILDRVDPNRERAKNGELCFGTVDTWLLWKFTDGTVHATDYSNASRTMLYNIHSLDWDDELLTLFNIPRAMLPEVRPSGFRFGMAQLNQAAIPISGIAGDQQSALFGQGCTSPGEAKNTYGTGCFLLLNVGKEPVQSRNGLITTLTAGCSTKPDYALEGSVFIGGAVIQWLRDELQLLDEAADSEYFAKKLSDNQGVYLVPAFVGLGAPHWDMHARGALFGLTRGSGRNHLIRAAVESIAYQTADVLAAMTIDADVVISHLRADGGAAANDFLMQFQADILNLPVQRPALLETTALGAVRLAGITEGIWKEKENREDNTTFFYPTMTRAQREKNIAGWQEALQRVKN